MMPYQTQTKDATKLAYRVWKAGHRSIARHSNISLEIKDISQDALRQLSRHPHINLTVKSTRYCDFTDTNFFIPDWVEDGLVELMVDDFDTILDIYKKWQKIEQENGQEDTAKLFLPLMSTTDLIMSANIQAMYEFLMLRNCVRASEEIREMSMNITKLLAEQDGLVGMIFSDLDCKGKEYGYCPEHEKCGKY
jgi:thymidylate synthase (FAD)